jgi:hypothetical protein
MKRKIVYADSGTIITADRHGGKLKFMAYVNGRYVPHSRHENLKKTTQAINRLVESRSKAEESVPAFCLTKKKAFIRSLKRFITEFVGISLAIASVIGVAVMILVCIMMA